VLVQLADIHFGYAGQDLFEGITWQVNAGEHIGLVGPNGAGKSTLLRLMAGELTPEAGQVARARGTTLAYLHQSQEFKGEGTVLSALLHPFAHVLALREELGALTRRLETDHAPADLARYGHLEEELRHKDGWAVEARVRELAADVGFGATDLARGIDTLSGGERNRLELAKVLLAAPDVLLLDEPTNHLDMEACERLEGFLETYPGAFVLVSHDRYFLDAVCREIVEVDGGELERYPGGWSAYVKDRDKRRELALQAWKRQQAEIERTEEFIRKNLAGQKTNQAKSRRKMLEKIERLELTSDAWQQAGRIGLRFEVGDHPGGKEAVVAEKLDVGYPGAAPLVTGLDLVVYRGDRLGIVGPNGAGKSTLLKTLLGAQPPLPGAAPGSLRRGHELRVGYFDQKLGGLDDERSLIDEIRSVRGDLSPDSVRNYLARFRFFGDEVFRVVRGLSGGERNRLSLAKMMLRPVNLLALDEPTNHLDIPAREVLERALGAYGGTLLVVSHDRFFLDQICTRLLVLEGDGRWSLETGNYSDWRGRQRARAPAAAVTAPSPRAPEKPDKADKPDKPDKPDKKTQAQTSYAEDKQRKADRARRERRLAALEDEISRLEGELAGIRTQLGSEHGGDWQRLHGLVEDERRLSDRLRSKMNEWEKLGEEVEG
jgi:ATP-binding cassette, subfamily F, member 3